MPFRALLAAKHAILPYFDMRYPSPRPSIRSPARLPDSIPVRPSQSSIAFAPRRFSITSMATAGRGSNGSNALATAAWPRPLRAARSLDLEPADGFERLLGIAVHRRRPSTDTRGRSMQAIVVFHPSPVPDRQGRTCQRAGAVRTGPRSGAATTGFPPPSFLETGKDPASVGDSRPHPPVSGASKTADTSTANPSSNTEAAVSPRPYRPCSTYASPRSASTVRVSSRGSAIQYSGIPASA